MRSWIEDEKPYFRISEQIQPFIIWHQMSGRVKRVHANDYTLGELDDWEGPTRWWAEKRRIRAELAEPDSVDKKSVTNDTEGPSHRSGYMGTPRGKRPQIKDKKPRGNKN